MPSKMTFNKDKVYTGVRPNKTTIGLMAKGTLTLGDATYQAISGPWNKGMMPNGTHTVKKYEVVASTDEAGYQSPTGKGWFIPLKQPASIKRSGFGIHPDGNVEGTAGCVGLVGTDADKFWDAWLKLSMSERPDSLDVTGASETPSSTYEISGEAGQE